MQILPAGISSIGSHNMGYVNLRMVKSLGILLVVVAALFFGYWLLSTCPWRLAAILLPFALAIGNDIRVISAAAKTDSATTGGQQCV